MDRLFTFDRKAREGFDGLMAGVDEAGRGPLAGPVVAAAVIFLRQAPLPYLNDSKQVLPARRETLFREISKISMVGIGIADEKEIDGVNIYQATRLAMKRAVLALSRTPDFVLVDGNLILDLPIPQKAVVKGDEKSASIAAASIIAKVYRDGWMTRLDGLYPGYEFKNHKGYGTPAHLKRLEEIGPSPVHRKSFSPVRVWGEER